MFLQQGEVVSPVKGGAGVGFARGGNVLMGSDAFAAELRAGAEQGAGERGKALILLEGVGMVIRAGEFDADGEVVAVVTPLIMRDAGMPSATPDGHVLADVAVAGNIKMGGDGEVDDAGKIGVLIDMRGQSAEKQGVNVLRGENAGGEGDVVDDQGVNGQGAFVVIRAGQADGVVQPAVRINMQGFCGGHGKNVMHSLGVAGFWQIARQKMIYRTVFLDYLVVFESNKL